MNLNNKTIFITGGTGSFGKAFINFVLKKYKPKKIIVYSRDEMKQYEMQKIFNKNCMRYYIGDVRDKNRLQQALGDGVDLLIHAAALKIVPTAEHDPIECIKTNIYGAENVISASLNNSNIKNVIALSTDKAANPINLYGATKLASDKLFVSANNIKGSKKTKFSIVRYGNVFGSRGSVLPLYLSLLDNNVSKLPLTHSSMTRFFIEIEDAVKFVLLASKEMKGGEIFIPKLRSFKITDLITSLTGSKNKFKLIGIRPGEKMHEVMFSIDDALNVIDFKRYYSIIPTIKFNDTKINYNISATGKKGKKLFDMFEYNSFTNKDFLSINEIKKYITKYTNDKN